MTHEPMLEQEEAVRFGQFRRIQRKFIQSFSGESLTDKLQGGPCAVGEPHTARNGIPDTPACRTMSAWLSAFSSGNRSQLDEGFKKYEPKKHADDFMAFRDRLGGLTSHRITLRCRRVDRQSKSTKARDDRRGNHRWVVALIR